VIIAFKLGRAQEEKAREMIAKGISMILTNPPETMGSETGNYNLLTKKGSQPITGTKEEIAASIWKEATPKKE